MAKKRKNSRRANGEGSIVQRKSDGKWVGSITIGYDEKGKQKKKIIYGKIKLMLQKS